MTSEKDTPSTASPRASRPVLVVDDQVEVRHLIMRILEGSGFDVVGAGNGAEALSLLKRGIVPGVIVLDLWMPIVDGWEFLDRADHGAPVVVISGLDDGTQPLPGCVVRFLKKPIGREELLGAIREAQRHGTA